MEKFFIIIVFDNIRSLNNIGFVFCMVDVFLIEKIYFCGIIVMLFYKDIIKIVLGVIDSVSWEYLKSILEVVEVLKKEGVVIVVIE